MAIPKTIDSSALPRQRLGARLQSLLRVHPNRHEMNQRNSLANIASTQHNRNHDDCQNCKYSFARCRHAGRASLRAPSSRCRKVWLAEPVRRRVRSGNVLPTSR